MVNVVKLVLSRARILTRNTHSPIYTSIRLESNKISSNLHKVNNLEKKFLVWTGKFKSVEEVPSMVAAETVEKARNRMRIRIANYMMLATLVACLLVSLSGRRARDRGESLQQRNLDWHKKIKEDSENEKEVASSSS